MRVRGVRILRLLVLGAGLAVVSPARAEEDHQACLDAYERAQRLKQAGALTASREQLLICGGPKCPTVMHADCGSWLAEVESSLPSVVFEVVSRGPRPLESVQIAIDGEPPSALDGRAIALDPGEHRVQITAPGHSPAKHRFLLSEGQKLRREHVTLSPRVRPEPAADAGKGAPERGHPSGPSRITFPVVAAGTVALLGAGGFVFWGLRARDDDRALDGCSPYCAQTQINDVRHQYLYSNLALGVGAVGAITAAVLLLVNPGKPQVSVRHTVQLGLCPGALGPSAQYRF